MNPFKIVASHNLPAIHAHAQAWDHPCGLRHIHIHAPDPHLSMMVHVPTSSDGDDGVAHALEHMVMEGSVSYPVDNIISRLSERTMSTFMNAMTSPSATIYPFSSANPADFVHIAQVYLDCVFNPRLPEEAFPLEVSRVVMKDGKKAFDGVVFNEMRGVFSDPHRIQYQQQRRWLAPDSPLTRNSGGDPLHIVDLSMDQLRQFHAEHYHPSRCTVVSYGDIDPVAIQDLIVHSIDPALSRPMGKLASAPNPSTAPIQDTVIDIPYADGDAEHGLMLAWPLALPENRLEKALYRAYAALLSSPGGHLADCLDDLSPASISQCSSVQVANRHYLIVAASSLAADQVPMARERILAAMQETLVDPPHQQTIASILNDTHMAILMRSASSDNLGHHLAMTMAQSMEDIADPAEILRCVDEHALLEQLRTHPIQEGFIQWLSEVTQSIPHQSHVRPDPAYYDNIARQLEEKLATREHQAAPQDRHADASSLPAAYISPEMVAVPPLVPVVWMDAAPGVSLCHVQGGVEGVYSIDVIADLSSMDPQSVDMVQSAINLAPMMGVDDIHWKEHAARSHQDGFSPSTNTDVENRTDGQVSILQRVSQSSLAHELHKTCGHLLGMIFGCTYDSDRLATILASVQEDLRSQASSRAQHAAHTHALCGFTPSGSINGVLRGLSGDMAGLWLARMSQSSPELLAQQLASALEDYRNAPMAIRVIGQDIPAAVLNMARQMAVLRPDGAAYHPSRSGGVSHATPQQDMAFVAPMHVNNCIQAWAGPGLFDAQGPAASLLAAIVSDQYLYGALRDKGGAYGASFSWSDGCFRAISFRDPRMSDTFVDFDGALSWIRSGAITQEHLHQARVKQIAQVTAPVSLLNRAKNAWSREVIGVGVEARAQFIQGLFDTSLEDLQAVATQWLSASSPRVRTASIGPHQVSVAAGMGMEVTDVPAMFANRPARSPTP